MRNFTKFAPSISAVLFLLGIPTLSLAHPIPDLPVFGTFDRNGTSSVLVEVDPRAFAEDPEAVPFLTVQSRMIDFIELFFSFRIGRINYTRTFEGFPFYP